jgi:hypothetical protein
MTEEAALCRLDLTEVLLALGRAAEAKTAAARALEERTGASRSPRHYCGDVPPRGDRRRRRLARERRAHPLGAPLGRPEAPSVIKGPPAPVWQQTFASFGFLSRSMVPRAAVCLLDAHQGHQMSGSSTTRGRAGRDSAGEAAHATIVIPGCRGPRF